MDQDAIIRYITDTFAGIDILRPTEGPGAGDTFIYYDPQRNRDPSHSLPFVTIVTKDYGEFDNSSKLDRPGVFRLNIGVGRDAFRALMGFAPTEASAKSAEYDFAALSQVMPHPIYAAQSWVCILSPSAEAFEAIKPLLAEAYSNDVKRHTSRQP